MWTTFLNWIETTCSWLFVGVCISIMVGLIALIVWKINNRIIAIILTAASCIFCSIPLISSINMIVEAKAKSLAISDKREELKNLKLQVENESLRKDKLQLENEKLNQSITIGNLNNEIDLIKNTQLSMNSLNKIFELALLETELKQTDVHKEQISSKEGKGVFADRIDNEVLVITTHDINAKYGVNLKEVLIYEDEKNILHVSGIKSKYVGSDRNVTDTKLNEIRQVEYKNGFISAVSVLGDKESIQKAQNYANKFEKEYQERLSKGLESNFMDDAVVKIAQNFITVTLAPLKKEIVFENKTYSNSVTIVDYLNNSIERIENEIQKL